MVQGLTFVPVLKHLLYCIQKEKHKEKAVLPPNYFWNMRLNSEARLSVFILEH